ncbi:DUF6522 family protein [Rhizobium sp. BK661]|uniref:DUF6522 family protein n=1 Tax=unclassified Rhizobium TaxID=2613769 RepID=UPI0038638F3B
MWAATFVVDAEQVASRFGLSQGAMRHHMKRGALVSIVEMATGEDGGNCRLSLRVGNRIWRVSSG